MNNTSLDSLYVYYKLAAADLERALVPAWQVLDAGRPYCRQARLLGRPQSKDGLATWMEVYEDVSDTAGLEAALAAAIGASGLASVMAGPRRSELFQALPDPAASRG